MHPREEPTELSGLEPDSNVLFALSHILSSYGKYRHLILVESTRGRRIGRDIAADTDLDTERAFEVCYRPQDKRSVGLAGSNIEKFGSQTVPSLGYSPLTKKSLMWLLVQFDLSVIERC